MGRLHGSSAGREAHVAEVALAALPAGPGALLVVDDAPGRVARGMEAKGWSVTRWSRMATAGCPGTPWPADGPFDAATLRLPKSKAALAFAIHAAASCVRAGGLLWLYGANDEGIKSADKILRGPLPKVRVAAARGHCRLLVATRPEAPDLRALAAWRAVDTLALPSGARDWVHYPGVFAKGGLDAGTAALLAQLPSFPAKARILDFACGTGIIAAELQAREPTLDLVLSDADALAIAAARENVPNAAHHVADGWGSTPAVRYAAIVSNPPIHQGKGEDFAVLRTVVTEAPLRLRRGGALWLVVQRQVPVRRWLDEAFAVVHTRHQDGRFQVLEAR